MSLPTRNSVVVSHSQPISLSTNIPASSNPKRKAAEDSVSLRRGTTPGSITESQQTIIFPPQLRHAPPNANLHVPERSSDVLGQSSLESGYLAGDSLPGNETNNISPDASLESGQRSTPEDWFHKWNTNVGEINKAAHPQEADKSSYRPKIPYSRKQNKSKSDFDRRAPFSLKERFFNEQGSSSRFEVDSCNTSSEEQMQSDNDHLALNSLFSFLPQESGSDDGFRGVIDDLTIKNQKLKKKLKKLQRVHCETLNEDKLFEVRFHGLPSAKKQELESLLQQFAASLNEPAPSEIKPISPLRQVPISKEALQKMRPPQSDSAYATESGTGGQTTSHSVTTAGIAIGRQRKASPSLAANSVRFSSAPDYSNERGRMKLVVQRLEGLFTGRVMGPAVSQSKEQQILSTIAAEDDARSRMNIGEYEREEGTREAALMTWQEDSAVSIEDNNKCDIYDTSKDSSSTSSSSPNQRPTRPMDLDPHREQIPAQNLEYLNHMTHSSLHTVPTIRSHSEDEVSEWVYLNLITNLAQLHTLNVSLPFIKRAIGTMSTKLELSPDSKKIRWKGGNVGSKLSSDSDSGGSSPNNGGILSISTSTLDLQAKQSTIKSKSDGSINKAHASDLDFNMGGVSERCLSSGTDLRNVSVTGGIKHNQQISQFHYKPIFRIEKQTERLDSDDSDCSDNSSEATCDDPNEYLDLLNSNGEKVHNWHKRSISVDGPVIFFGGAPFCSDLSAQALPEELPEGILRYNKTNYLRNLSSPIGLESKTFDFMLDASQRPLFTTDLHDSLSSMDIDSSPLLRIVPSETLPEPMSLLNPEPKILEASGLGGIRPDDNFMINVLVKHTARRSRRSNLVSRVKKVEHVIRKSSLDAFHEISNGGMNYRAQKSVVQQEMVHINTTQLAPPKLPSPSYGVFSSSDESSYDSSTTQLSHTVHSSNLISSNVHDANLDNDTDSWAGGWTSGENDEFTSGDDCLMPSMFTMSHEK